MNWKDVPNLFANGKFKIRHGNFLDMPVEIEGIDGKYFIAERLNCNVNDCTLIARKIEDMTDKEVVGMTYGKSAMLSFTSEDNFHLSVKDLIYLLSIGVYPFDQTHFEDGTVININK